MQIWAFVFFSAYYELPSTIAIPKCFVSSLIAAWVFGYGRPKLTICYLALNLSQLSWNEPLGKYNGLIKSLNVSSLSSRGYSSSYVMTFVPLVYFTLYLRTEEIVPVT